MKKNRMNSNQNGVIHHLALFVLIGLVLAGVSFAGWRVWQSRSEAKAFNYITVGFSDWMNTGGCSVKSGNNVVKVNFKTTRFNAKVKSVELGVKDNKGKVVASRKVSNWSKNMNYASVSGSFKSSFNAYVKVVDPRFTYESSRELGPNNTGALTACN